MAVVDTTTPADVESTQAEVQPAAPVDQELETRKVEVHDPTLSAETNQRLTEQLQEVVGKDTAQVPRARVHASQGEAPETNRGALASNGSLMMTIGIFAALVIIGIVGAGVTNSWIFVAAALLVDIIGVVVVATVVIRMTGITERPEATLAAAMEREGVTNPEERFTEMVEEFMEADVTDGEHRTHQVEDAPVGAAAEQRTAMTPTGGRSRAVGL